MLKHFLSQGSKVILTCATIGAAGILLPVDSPLLHFSTDQAYAAVSATGSWGPYPWDIEDNVLTIYEASGSSVEDFPFPDTAEMPWIRSKFHDSVEKVVIQGTVIAPTDVSHMFSGLTNLTSADLSGLDTSDVVIADSVFADCPKLSEVKISTKTIATNIFTGLEGKGFVSKDGTYGPYSPSRYIAGIDNSNQGWFNIVPFDPAEDSSDTASDKWGSCEYLFKNGVLTIFEGTGADISSYGPDSIPWYNHRDAIKTVVISENVIAPKNISYMFAGMENLVSADLTGLDTSNVTTTGSAFADCTKLSEIKIGPKTVAKDILTGFRYKALVHESEKLPPYLPATLSSSINEDSLGWYNVKNAWGTCLWDIDEDGVLTIHQGTGENLADCESAPWYEDNLSINKIVISEKVIAPPDISYMFYFLSNMTSADLSGFDTSNVTTANDVFEFCERLTEIRIGTKTFAKDVFTGVRGSANKHFLSKDGDYGPFSPAECATAITDSDKSVGWYNIISKGTWGTCSWTLVNGVLTIDEGIGANTLEPNADYIPWYDDRMLVKKIVISKNVIAPESISYLFCGMENLTSADLSGLDTSTIRTYDTYGNNTLSVFKGCNKLSEIKIGAKTCANNIFTDITDKKFVSRADNKQSYSPAELPYKINGNNIGWYNIS